MVDKLKQIKQLADIYYMKDNKSAESFTKGLLDKEEDDTIDNIERLYLIRKRIDILISMIEQMRKGKK